MILGRGHVFPDRIRQPTQADEVGVGEQVLLQADDDVGSQPCLLGQPGAIEKPAINQQERQICGGQDVAGPRHQRASQ